MRRILSFFNDLCVFAFARAQCWHPCVSLTSLDPWLRWYLTPVSPSLSPGPLWFLPSFMDITPTRLRASLMVTVSSVCGLLPPRSSGFCTCFFFHLLQNCKSNKSFNTSFPLVLYVVTAAVDVVWPPPSDCSLSFTGSLFLSLALTF